MTFNQPIAGVLWPCFMQNLAFGSYVNHSIVGIVWPASLQQLLSGPDFASASLEWCLHQLAFGLDFNQPVVTGVVWPSPLMGVPFGRAFNQPIADVAWPASLHQLSFGVSFSHHIAGVQLPASLQQLSVGNCFNQLIHEVVWPTSLRGLSFQLRSTSASPNLCGQPPSNSCRSTDFSTRPSPEFRGRRPRGS